MRTPLLVVTGSSILLSVASGCVPQQKYDELLTAYRGKEQQTMKMQDELQASQANEALLRKQLQDQRSYLDQLKTVNSEQANELEQMEGDFQSLSQRITSLRVAALPPELNAKLTHLRDAYPDLLTFDEATGLLRFNTDMSFGLGSADLSSDAKSAMANLASILNSSAGNGFDLDIVGHTDNVPVNRPATKRRYPDNMHLGVGRAMAVRAQLGADSVTPTRIKVGGWGEHRPLKPNPNQGGESANRRVDLYLIPGTTPMLSNADESGGSSTTQQATGQESMDDFPPK